MAEEININIRNTIDVTNQNNPAQTPRPQANGKPTSPKQEKSKMPTVAGISVQQWASTGIRLAGVLGFDTSALSKIAHYGFSIGKAIAGIQVGDYKDCIQLVVEVSTSVLEEMRKDAQKQAATENAIDQARVQLGLMDIGGYSAKVNRWSGRVTYSKIGGSK